MKFTPNNPASDVHLRLKAARKLAGYRSASAAAKALDMPKGTYCAHENGHRSIRVEAVLFYSEHFSVQASWLMFGDDPAAPGEVLQGEAA